MPQRRTPPLLPAMQVGGGAPTPLYGDRIRSALHRSDKVCIAPATNVVDQADHAPTIFMHFMIRKGGCAAVAPAWHGPRGRRPQRHAACPARVAHSSAGRSPLWDAWDQDGPEKSPGHADRAA